MGEASFGKYRLIAELGHGGMADVFLAVQAGPSGSGFRKLTVVKRLRQNLADEPEFVAMLVDEARIAARLNHPNVVQTNEVGQVGNHYFIAMEYLDGQPLHRIQHRATQREKKGEDPLITKDMQYIILMDTLAGLHHAHELCDYDGTPLQIVHRDMTPHNIFVTYAGQVKVVDFGIAKAVGRASETRQGVVKGKVRYMAPEQAIGQNIDRRVDIFSVGVMLWEVAAGRRMWKDMDDLQIVQMLIGGQTPVSPRAVEPSVPEALDRICQKALSMKPEDRYATAEEFRADLEQYLSESRALVDARRKLTPALGELFTDKRTEIKSIIEKQLAALEEKASGEFQAVALAGDSNTSASAAVGPSVAPAARSSETSTSFTDAPTSLYSAQKGRLARRVLAGAGAVALAGVIALAVPWGKKAPANVEPPTIQSAAPAEINLRLMATPLTARVSIDDGPARSVPVDARVTKDDREHRLRIEADGYSPRLEVVHFTNDISMSVDLHPLPQQGAGAGSAKKQPPPPVAVVTVVKTVQAPPTKPTEATPPPTVTHAPTAPPDSTKPGGTIKREVDKGDPWAK